MRKPGSRRAFCYFVAVVFFGLDALVDVDDDRQPGRQVLGERLVRIDADADADALGDLDEIAGGIVRP
jgi:hypothetical protein